MDDLLMVLHGKVDIEMREGTIKLRGREGFAVPTGGEHRPEARQEAHLLLIAPPTTPNIGDLDTAVAKEAL